MRLHIRLGVAAAVVLVIAIAALAGLYAGRPHTTRPNKLVSRHVAHRKAPTTDEQITDLQGRISHAPAKAENYTVLGNLYLQKARESGDPAYYNLADGILKKSLNLDPESADTLVALAGLAITRHQFEDGLALGQRALSLDARKTAVYGVIEDAQVQLGRYDEAFATAQAMEDLRPDLSSYTRVSYLRELQGDLPGAIELMRQAADAGAIGSEARAWTQVQLGTLYFNGGDLAAAEAEYRHALYERPGYLHARAGLASIKAAQGDFEQAASLYDAIVKIMPLPQYVIALADVYRAAGNNEDALQAEALVGVEDQLQRASGVNTDAEMALFAADHDIDLSGALGRAQAAAAVRPSVFAEDVLAWTLYKNGRYEEAQAASDQALRLGWRDGLARYHAGMIALRLGQTERARIYLAEALTQNPSFSLRYAAEAKQTLQSLTTSPPVHRMVLPERGA